jgi:hypothetical protein
MKIGFVLCLVTGMNSGKCCQIGNLAELVGNLPYLSILAAWWEASDSAKIARLKVHFERANSNGVLDQVAEFLYGL